MAIKIIIIVIIIVAFRAVESMQGASRVIVVCCMYMYICIFVTRRAWICAIPGLSCATGLDPCMVCDTINESLDWPRNPGIALRKACMDQTYL